MFSCAGFTNINGSDPYRRGLEHCLFWYQTGGFNKATVQACRAGLSPSTINLYITAARRLAVEAGDNGLLPPEIVSGIQRVRGIRHEGTRIGNWLTESQGEHLLYAPDVSSLKRKRDPHFRPAG